MEIIREFWRTSPPEQKDYLFIYLWGALWGLVYLTIPPLATVNAFSTVLIALWTLTTVAGGVMCAYGLVHRDNLILERFGISLLSIGPLAFALTQLGLLIVSSLTGVGDPFSRIHLIFFALWPYLFLNKRRRQLRASVRLAKKLPLMEEAGK